MTNEFAIICDARCGYRQGISKLALVDRGKTKTLWWTSDKASLILRYQSKSAADYACRRLRFNAPRVVPYERAASVIAEQAADILEFKEDAIRRAAEESQEMGWDAHKVS